MAARRIPGNIAEKLDGFLPRNYTPKNKLN